MLNRNSANYNYEAENSSVTNEYVFLADKLIDYRIVLILMRES